MLEKGHKNGTYKQGYTQAPQQGNHKPKSLTSYFGQHILQLIAKESKNQKAQGHILRLQGKNQHGQTQNQGSFLPGSKQLQLFSLLLLPGLSTSKCTHILPPYLMSCSFQ